MNLKMWISTIFIGIVRYGSLKDSGLAHCFSIHIGQNLKYPPRFCQFQFFLALLQIEYEKTFASIILTRQMWLNLRSFNFESENTFQDLSQFQSCLALQWCLVGWDRTIGAYVYIRYSCRNCRKMGEFFSYDPVIPHRAVSRVQQNGG